MIDWHMSDWTLVHGHDGLPDQYVARMSCALPKPKSVPIILRVDELPAEPDKLMALIEAQLDNAKAALEEKLREDH